MFSLLSCVIVVLQASPPAEEPPPLNWAMQIANMNVPDPTRPDAVPDLGYTGLWRTIYGDGEETNVTANSFGSNTRPGSGGSNTPATGLKKREPRIRTAKWVAAVQLFNNLPSFNVPRRSLDTSMAAFVWDHQVEQLDDRWAGSTYTEAQNSAAREYSPASVAMDEERKDFSEAARKSNYIQTILIALIALGLLVVMAFMPS